MDHRCLDFFRAILAQFTNATTPLLDPLLRRIVLCNHYPRTSPLLSSVNVLPHRFLRSYMFHFCCPAVHDILQRLCSNTRSLYKLLKLLDLVTCRDFGCITSEGVIEIASVSNYEYLATADAV